MATERLFFLTTIPGLEMVAHLELCERWAAARAFHSEIPELPIVRLFTGGLEVWATPALMGDLLPRLRTVQRVLLRLGTFDASSPEAMLKGLQAIHWPDIFRAGDSYRVQFTSRSSKLSKETQAETLMGKALKGLKLRASKEGLGLFLRVFRDSCTVSVDLTGADGFKREDGRMGSIASLRSSTAAGLLRVLLQGLREPFQLIDPMCGSGTFLIEAAQANQPLQRQLTFAGLPLYAEALKQSQRGGEAGTLQEESLLKALYGCDKQAKAVQLAKANFAHLGLQGTVEQADLFKPQQGRRFQSDLARVVVINPPWGKRLPGADQDFLAAAIKKYEPVRLGLLMPSHWKVEVSGLEKVRDLPLLNSGVENRFLVFA